MRELAVAPSGVERRMPANELIVSKTDTKGLITYANDVFQRVAGYTEDQLVGQPHNIVRHPDMPRAVFKLLWDTLEAGQEIFAYVNNLASDGAHYWVFAHITPSRDAHGRTIGYHSNRRAPAPDAVAVVHDLYAVLRAEERRAAHSPDGLAASTRLLQETLDSRGQSYDDFVWSVTP